MEGVVVEVGCLAVEEVSPIRERRATRVGRSLSPVERELTCSILLSCSPLQEEDTMVEEGDITEEEEEEVSSTRLPHSSFSLSLTSPRDASMLTPFSLYHRL